MSTLKSVKSQVLNKLGISENSDKSIYLEVFKHSNLKINGNLSKKETWEKLLKQVEEKNKEVEVSYKSDFQEITTKPTSLDAPIARIMIDYPFFKVVDPKFLNFSKYLEKLETIKNSPNKYLGDFQKSLIENYNDVTESLTEIDVVNIVERQKTKIQEYVLCLSV